MATDPNSAIDEAQANVNAQLQALLAQYAQQVGGYTAQTGAAYTDALNQMGDQAGRVSGDIQSQGFNAQPVQQQSGLELGHLREQYANQQALGNNFGQLFTGGIMDRMAHSSQISAIAKAQGMAALAAAKAKAGRGGGGGYGGYSHHSYGGGSGDVPAQGDAKTIAEADTPIPDYRTALLTSLSGKLKPKTLARVQKWLASGNVKRDLSNVVPDFARFSAVIQAERKKAGDGNHVLGEKLSTLQRQVGKRASKLQQDAAKARRKRKAAQEAAALRNY